MKRSLINTIALGSLLTCSAAVMAEQSDYKLMVIEEVASAPQEFEVTFNNCALNVKSKNYNQAEVICSKVVTLFKQSKSPRFKVRELTSFALRNRGLGRLMAKNETAALSDFYEVQQMSGNELVSHNLTRAKQELAL